MKNSSVVLSFAFACLALAGGASAQTLTLPEFVDCVGANTHGYGSTCILTTTGQDVGGYFYIPSSAYGYSVIAVTRSNIVVEGDPTCTYCTGFLRPPGTTATSNPSLMVVKAEGVTVSNLVFNGAGNGSLSSGTGPFTGPYAYIPTPCQTVTPSCTQFIDLDLRAAYQYGYNTTTVTNCIFDNSPSTSVFGTAFTAVEYNTFYQGYTFVLMWSRSPAPTEYVTVNSNDMAIAGGAAFALDGYTSNAYGEYNIVDQGHMLCYDGNPGGVIDVPSGEYITISNNVVNGEGVSCSNGWVNEGLEMYGTGHTVIGNTFEYLAGAGMYISAANNITIENNTSSNDGQDGLFIGGSSPGNACLSGTLSYTVENNTLENNGWYGIEVYPNCDSGSQPVLASLSPYPSTSYNTISDNALGPTHTY